MEKQVVIIGRLVSLTRAEARQLTERAGYELSERVTSETGTVVLGGLGPHFQPNGRPVVQLARARRLLQSDATLEILQEEEWLESLSLTPASSGIKKHFTAGQIADTLQITRAKFDRWLAAHLLHPVEISCEIPLFDFSQVIAARTLAELGRRGVRLPQLRRAARQLARWPRAGKSLADVSLAEDAHQLLVRTGSGHWAEPTGQLLFDFDSNPDCTVLTLTQTETQSAMFRRALACEEDNPSEAAALYRQIIAEHGPHPTLAFNLANSLYAANEPVAAVAAYREALELDPQHAGAWNNLANLLTELGQLDESLEAYRRALAIDSRLSDARFNLAQTLVELGRKNEAVLHWRAYLSSDDESTWADYARDQLAS